MPFLQCSKEIFEFSLPIYFKNFEKPLQILRLLNLNINKRCHGQRYSNDLEHHIHKVAITVSPCSTTGYGPNVSHFTFFSPFYRENFPEKKTGKTEQKLFFPR